MVMEKTSKEIGVELYLSVRTVENHRFNIYRKSGTKNIFEFIHFIINHHITAGEPAFNLFLPCKLCGMNQLSLTRKQNLQLKR